MQNDNPSAKDAAEMPQGRDIMVSAARRGEVASFPRLLATDEFRMLYQQEVTRATAPREQLAVTWRSLMVLALGWGALTTAFAASGMASEAGLVAALRSAPVLRWFIGF